MNGDALHQTEYLLNRAFNSQAAGTIVRAWALREAARAVPQDAEAMQQIMEMIIDDFTLHGVPVDFFDSDTAGFMLMALATAVQRIIVLERGW